MSSVVGGVPVCLVADVSSAQGVIDASAAARAGIDGIIVKATQGGGYVNPYRSEQVGSTLAARLACAEYHFLDGSASGAAQAAHFLAVARNPRFLDSEAYPPSNPTYRHYLDFHTQMHARGQRQLHDYTGAWWWGNRPGNGYPAAGGAWGNPPAHRCGAVWPSAYVVGSGTPGQLLAKVTLNPLWWGRLIDSWPSCVFRQFTSSASIPGLGARVDLSVFIGTRAQLDAFFGGAAVPTPVPTPTPAPPPPPPPDEDDDDMPKLLVPDHTVNRYYVIDPALTSKVWVIDPASYAVLAEMKDGNGKPMYVHCDLPPEQIAACPDLTVYPPATAATA